MITLAQKAPLRRTIMPGQQSKIDLGNLEKRVADLQKNLAFVGQSNNSSSSDLFKIIHRPGWTTIAQVEIANHILDAMNQQATALKGLQNVLESHVKEASSQG
jgi:hypothetical protein